MIEGIAVGNVFQGHTARPAENVGVVRLESPVDLTVGLLETFDKRVY